MPESEKKPRVSLQAFILGLMRQAERVGTCSKGKTAMAARVSLETFTISVRLRPRDRPFVSRREVARITQGQTTSRECYVPRCRSLVAV